jgi:hypothetical protein
VLINIHISGIRSDLLVPYDSPLTCRKVKHACPTASRFVDSRSALSQLCLLFHSSTSTTRTHSITVYWTIFTACTSCGELIQHALVPPSPLTCRDSGTTPTTHNHSRLQDTTSRRLHASTSSVRAAQVRNGASVEGNTQLKMQERQCSVPSLERHGLG